MRRNKKKGLSRQVKERKGFETLLNPLFLFRCIRPEAMGPNKGSGEATKPPQSPSEQGRSRRWTGWGDMLTGADEIKEKKKRQDNLNR